MSCSVSSPASPTIAAWMARSADWLSSHSSARLPSALPCLRGRRRRRRPRRRNRRIRRRRRRHNDDDDDDDNDDPRLPDAIAIAVPTVAS
eukprot:5611359-Pyramimonas_sp.AAC.2